MRYPEVPQRDVALHPVGPGPRALGVGRRHPAGVGVPIEMEDEDPTGNPQEIRPLPVANAESHLGHAVRHRLPLPGGTGWRRQPGNTTPGRVPSTRAGPYGGARRSRPDTRAPNLLTA